MWGGRVPPPSLRLSGFSRVTYTLVRIALAAFVNVPASKGYAVEFDHVRHAAVQEDASRSAADGGGRVVLKITK